MDVIDPQVARALHNPRKRVYGARPAPRARLWIWLALGAGLMTLGSIAQQALAAALPEERGEALYHSYDGGGVEVSGPALLVRKNVAEKFSMAAEYYVDSISGASIDVVTNASPYSERRTEYGFGVDWLYGDTLLSLAASQSDENDYDATTFSFDIAHELFGNMTRINMGYSRGSDTVMRVDNDFEADIERASYRLGVSQVLSPTLVSTVDYEAILDDGFLNNPYRSARVLGASVPERYPSTRTSHALALRLMKYWNERWSTRAEYRYFTDTWDVRAHTLEVGVNTYVRSGWLLEGHYRHYTQGNASFYADNFDREFVYMARDKELSSFNSHAVGGRLSIELLPGSWGIVERASLNVGYDFIRFDYDDFTDVRTGELYDFTTHVVQIFVTAWY
ncbi:DUF3570 domain-containing protein [soil metagenome]